MELINELKDRLKNGEVSFTYRKKDGSIRIAKGTLNFDIMGEENQPKSGIDYDSDTTTRYFDIDSNGWRSFKNDNFIEIVKNNDIHTQDEFAEIYNKIYKMLLSSLLI